MHALPPVVVSGWPKVARAAAKAVPPPSTTLSLSVGVAIAAIGAAAAAALAPAMLRQLRVQLPLLLVHLALLHRSEGGHLFSSWAAFRAWPVFQYELRKLIGLEASHRLDSLTHVDTGGAPALGRSLFRRVLWPFAVGGGVRGGGGMGGGAPDIVLKDLVLIGGGHSHVHVLKMFGMKPMPGVQITLITRDVETPYSGMIPGYVAGHYTREECHIDLSKLATFANARFIHAEATGIDTTSRQVLLKGRPSVAYDVLSINTGSAPQPLLGSTTASTDARHARGVTPVKPIDGFCSRWDQILQRTADAAADGRVHTAKNGIDAEAAERASAVGRAVRLVVVGGGAGGVELALSMQSRLSGAMSSRGLAPSLVRVSLVSRSAVLMPQHTPAIRAAFAAILTRRGIEVLTGEEVTGAVPPVDEAAEPKREMRVGSLSEPLASGSMRDSEDPGMPMQDPLRKQSGRLLCASGRVVEYDEAIWCTQGGAAPWLASQSPLELDPSGFVAVHPTLESISHPGVFAAGDVASVLAFPRPKAGVFAVRQGPPLANNLRAKLLGRPLEPFEPQQRFLGLIGTGDGGCVASKGPLCLEAPWLWGLKDWIDRTWMAAYTTQLPKMDQAHGPPSELATATGSEALDALSHASMRCGGCGAKVGATVLTRVMARLKAEGHLPEAKHHTVLIGMDAPDDCAVLAPSPLASVHSVDFFRSFIGDPFVFGQVAANHALSDCHAMGAPPAGVLAVAVVPYGLEAKVEATLFQMMAGACKTLGEAGAALLGGHTCEGAELSLGFAVVGYAPLKALFTKAGLEAGQLLLLTKPVGTGALFAAAMRGAAPGAAIAAATASMVQSNAPAAAILARHGATACTDVTGFGLLGHLLEMASASNARVSLQLDAIPALPGVAGVLEQKIFSSLQPANLRLRRALSNEARALKHRNYPLLFDPQTAGGLLAAVPTSTAEAAVAELRACGYGGAVVIGTVEEVLSAEDACPAALIECV